MVPWNEAVPDWDGTEAQEPDDKWGVERDCIWLVPPTPPDALSVGGSRRGPPFFLFKVQWNSWALDALRPHSPYIGFDFVAHLPKDPCGSLICKPVRQLAAMDHPQDHSVNQVGVGHAFPPSCSSARGAGWFELAASLTS